MPGGANSPRRPPSSVRGALTMDFLEPFEYTFMQYAFVAAVLAAVVCGIVGSYIVVKRLVFISGGIAHTSFGGIGLGYYLGLAEPIWGAVVFALATAVMVGIASLKARIREDSTIGILWVVGMALGIVFMQMTEGYKPDPVSVLFGNILLIKEIDLWYLLVLVILVMVVVGLLYKELLAMSFDEEFARISGVRTGALYIMLLCLVALTVILLIKVVGVILVIALLTIPAALAGLFTYNLKRMIVLAVVFGLVFNLGGLMVSWVYNLPPEATIVIIGGAVFSVALGIRTLRRRGHERALSEDGGKAAV